MSTHGTRAWAELERWSPRLFAVAAVCLLFGAANSGVSFFLEGYAFDSWLGIVLELGRLAALLGTAGLSVRVADRGGRLGTLGRVVAALAVLAIAALITLVTLEVLGVLTDPVGAFGLVAYVLSVSAFLLVGVGIVRTGAHPRWVGIFLLANVAALLVVFFGRLFVPLGLLAAVVQTVQVVLYASVGYVLRAQRATAQQTTLATETTP